MSRNMALQGTAMVGTIVVSRNGGMAKTLADARVAWRTKGNQMGRTSQAQLAYSRLERWSIDLMTYLERVCVRCDNKGAEVKLCKLIALFHFRLLVLTQVRLSA